MKESLRQSQAWLHTWSGLTVGWVLFMIFAFGTLSFFKDELTDWMRPELNQIIASKIDKSNLTTQATTLLQQQAPIASQWSITFPNQRNPVLQLAWFGEKGFGKLLIDPNSGEVITPRETVGGDFFYLMHFQFWYISPIKGRIIISIISMFMLVSLITGIIVHKKIFKEFFTLRLKKGARSWLDGHNLAAVISLPFHLMITFTGLLLLVLFFIPSGYKTIYQGQMGKFYQQVFNMADFSQVASKQYQPLPSLTEYIDQFNQQYTDQSLDQITIYNPLNSNSQIALTSKNSQGIMPLGLLFDSNGQIVSSIGASKPAAKTLQALYSLHKGYFANYLLRWLYFLAGIAGCFIIASGLVLWVIRRQIKHNPQPISKLPFSHRLVQVLNIASIAGLCCATPCLLLANRLLAIDLPQRSNWEVRVFFIVWAATLLYAIVRSHKKAWIELFIIAASCCLLVPISNALTTNVLSTIIQQPQWRLVTVDLSFIVAAIIFGWLSYLLQKHQPTTIQAKQNKAFKGSKICP